MAAQPDPTINSAFETAAKLKLGAWESVEAAAILVSTAPHHPESARLLAAAQATASQLKAGTWDSVRALAWLARAQRELG